MESSVDIPLNDWTHLAITFDSLRMSKWLYINGTLVGKVTGSPATFRLGPLEYDPAPVPVTIGSDWFISYVVKECRILAPDRTASARVSDRA